MTTSNRRNQNAAASELPEDIDAVLERQIKQTKSREEYNQRTEVKERRKEYQAKQQRLRAMSNAALKGNKALLMAETVVVDGKETGGFGFSEEAADVLIAKANEHS